MLVPTLGRDTAAGDIALVGNAGGILQVREGSLARSKSRAVEVLYPGGQVPSQAVVDAARQRRVADPLAQDVNGLQ